MAKFKVLKSGETDINSTDIWRFCVHSDYPTQKIAVSGTGTLTILSGNTYGSLTISHSLGYAPTVMAMFEVYGGRFVKVAGQKGVYRPDDQESAIYSIKSTTTSVTFYADPLFFTEPASGNIGITIHYMFLYENV